MAELVWSTCSLRIRPLLFFSLLCYVQMWGLERLLIPVMPIGSQGLASGPLLMRKGYVKRPGKAVEDPRIIFFTSQITGVVIQTMWRYGLSVVGIIANCKRVLDTGRF